MSVLLSFRYHGFSRMSRNVIDNRLPGQYRQSSLRQRFQTLSSAPRTRGTGNSHSVKQLEPHIRFALQFSRARLPLDDFLLSCHAILPGRFRFPIRQVASGVIFPGSTLSYFSQRPIWAHLPGRVFQLAQRSQRLIVCQKSRILTVRTLECIDEV